MPRKILAVVGARPNLVKIAPILRAIAQRPAGAAGAQLACTLVHTGQHYDAALSDDFFMDLRLPPPDHLLGVGSGSHAQMTAEIMRRLEPVLLAEQPDVVLVVGDVNSTLASALTAAHLGLPVAHVEAGLRSFDRAMPEEINRVVTDALSTFLFTSEAAANDNLRREGHAADRIRFVGNVVIDSLHWGLPLARLSTIGERLGLAPDAAFALLTVHRPSNVDAPASLGAILSAATSLALELPVILPAHPRTRAHIATLGLSATVRPFDAGARAARGHILMTEPLGYVDFLHLLTRARLVLTDSGGVQEETTVLGVPCLTLRERTERPVTVHAGTSVLVGADPTRIAAAARAALANGRRSAPASPPLWDGHAADRIVAALAE
ncbi:MAG: UDP-N-acetylglucosamine 2-epimerase (non-hydrolyzing) [bacterium]